MSPGGKFTALWICRTKAKADNRKVLLEELQGQLEKSQAEVWLAMLEAEENAEKLAQKESDVQALTAEVKHVKHVPHQAVLISMGRSTALYSQPFL